jgi:uncharacterized protein YqfA (UPF0365 family)
VEELIVQFVESGAIALVVLVVVALAIFFWLVPVKLWIQAIASGVKVGLLNLVGMRLRLVNPHVIVNPLIEAIQANAQVTINQLETHLLAGGNVDNVVAGLISARNANIPLTFEQAAAIDLAGRNVRRAVSMSVEPAVIMCPMPGYGAEYISAVAQDGVQLKVRAQVTVRANLEKLVGGATEETVIARIGEGIVSGIGSTASHSLVLENPDIISRRVLERGLDEGTAFEIISIDIADIDVGRNIGSELQISQADADKKVAQAKAEARRAQAVATEQENVAKIADMRANLVAAEAEVPKALASALTAGRLGVMDYYNLKNIVADTDMRKSIGTPPGEGPKGPGTGG